ncbi:MAG: hypothetical protein R2911_36175 [Caldilineaceae bacterium]
MLTLAECLAAMGDGGWTTYFATYFTTAERNLEQYILGRLWDDKRHRLHNTFAGASFVPNKAATTVEALLLWARMRDSNAILEEYVAPTLDAIVAAQVHAPGQRRTAPLSRQ